MSALPFSGFKIKDRILLSFLGLLAAGEKVLDYFPTQSDVVRSLYTTAPKSENLSNQSLRRIFLRVLGEKLIAKEETERGVRFHISEKGFSYLHRKFPILKLRNKKFDGHLRFVIYDITEAERNLRSRVRSGLKTLGFKMIQQSVWASPLDLEKELDELFGKLKLEEKALVLSVQLPKTKTEDLIKKHWSNIIDKNGRFHFSDI